MYHQKYYKLIGTDLSRQTNSIIPQHINFTDDGADEDNGATMFLTAEKQQKSILNFSLG